MTAVLDVAKKKVTLAAPDPAPKRRESVIGLKGLPEWKFWLAEFAEHCRLSMADTIDLALTELAHRRGFRPPPKR
jgi:hypothetical protein